MSVREGVYTIKRAKDQYPLGLDHRWWNRGNLVVGESPSAAPNHLISQDQKWLVVRPPGASPDVYVLCNVNSGGYACVLDGKRGHDQSLVACSPMRSSSAHLQWRAIPNSSHSSDFSLAWLHDESKVLTSSDSGHRVSVEDDARHKEDPDCHRHYGLKHWQFCPSDPSDASWPDWMGRLPDDICLADINLPSTHQSLANRGIDRLRPDLDWQQQDNAWLHSWVSPFRYLSGVCPLRPWIPLPAYIDNPRCQGSSLWEQLVMGIRAFDVRLDLDQVRTLDSQSGQMEESNCVYFLYARHGLAELNHAWSAVLLTIKLFLELHSSEFIIMNVRYEKSTQVAHARSADWLQTFVEETEPFWKGEKSIVYRWWEHCSPNMTDLQLRDVRGQVILTQDGDYMPADGENGRRPFQRFVPPGMRCAGQYDSVRSEWDTHLRHCEDNLQAARSSSFTRQPHLYYQTSFNVSGLPAPLKYTYMLRDPLHPRRAMRNAHNEVFDPKDFFEYLYQTWSNRGDDCPLSERSLGKNGRYRIGKVDLDFAEAVPEWVANIIRSNRSKKGREF